jgi:hypothetical protein
MKKTVFLLLSILILCGCGDSSNRKIIIKGQIPTANKTNGSPVKSSASLTLADATKVLVYFGFHDIAFADIVNGSFSTTAEIGKAAALVFLDANNNYIGTLQNRELSLLPLGNLSNGDQTIIDLATLTLVGTNVIPSHDPFGKEIDISQEEINSLKELDGFFESLAKNIDTDNDGVLDVLGNKQLFIISHFNVTAGHWGLNENIPYLPDSSQINIGYAIDVFGDSGFDQIINKMTLSGPEGNPYAEIKTEFINSQHMNSGFFSRFIILDGQTVVNQPFRKGIYTLDIEGKLYTFGFSNIDANKNLVIAVPTLHTNSNGQLTSFTIEYKLPNGQIINPENILTDIMLQFSGSNGNVIYESPWLSKYKTGGNHVLGIYSHTTEKPVDISNLTGIVIGYNDMLGNRYDTWWH